MITKLYASKSRVQILQNIEQILSQYYSLILLQHVSSFTSECKGFWCNPPYRKCIAINERCDGKADCMGAEDEMECPYLGYNQQLRNSMPPGYVAWMNQWRRTHPPPMHTYDNYRNTEMMNRAEEGEKQQQGMGPAMPSFMPPASQPPMFMPPAQPTPPAAVETTTYQIAVPDMPERFACKR